LTITFPDLTHDGEINFDLDMGMHFNGPWTQSLSGDRIREWPHHRNTSNGHHRRIHGHPRKSQSMRRSMVNARSEKILDDNAPFWHRIRKTRCLIPEPASTNTGDQGWKNKIPYHIELKTALCFGIPGLYHYNTKTPSDPERERCGHVYPHYKRANSVMRQIHIAATMHPDAPLPAKRMELNG